MSFPPIPRKPPTLITSALTRPFRSRMTSLTLPMVSLLEPTAVVPISVDAKSCPALGELSRRLKFEPANCSAGVVDGGAAAAAIAVQRPFT